MFTQFRQRQSYRQGDGLSAVRFLTADNENLAGIEARRRSHDAADVVVRALTTADARAFRAIGLEALNRDARYFATDIAAEAARTEAQWAAACDETSDNAVFGSFVGDQLVGIMAARTWDSDGAARSVCWGSAYVQPAHRRSGVGLFLYGTREQWSKQHGFAVAVFAIRADNFRSTEIHKANGAECFASETVRYADGSDALTHWYRKTLGYRTQPARHR